MKPRPLFIAGSVLVIAAAAFSAALAIAGKDCDIPLTNWQSREAVHQMAEQKGWQIERLKIDDGCYEVRATDAEGRRIKAKLNPQTLEVIKLKQRDRKEDRKRERERERQHSPQDSAQDTITPSSIFTSGSTPRAQVE